MKDAVTIVPIDSDHPFASIVIDWIQDEWGETTGYSRESTTERLLWQENCPPTHVAVASHDGDDGSPVGVVAFIRYASPLEEVTAPGPQLWINALYVAPEHRNRKMGSQLVTHAQRLAKSYEDRLFVYTDIPDFYLRLGWTVITEPNAEGCVRMMRELSEPNK